MEEKDKYYGKNGFIWACENGHFEIVKYLIQHTDCNLQVKDKYGHNAFDIAHKRRKFKIMVYLVKYKIGFNYQFREKLIFDQIFVNTMKREMKNIKSIENFLNKFFIDDEMEQPIKLIIHFSYGLENLENFLIYPNKETSQKRKSTFSLGNSKKKQRRI
jgi:ankyrin repeat protein